MITILTWLSIIAGGILILLLLLSILGGLDFDLDIDADIGSTDVETDAGGLGLIKGVLIFISVSSWMMKILLVSGKHLGLALGIGIFSGVLAFLLLRYLFKLLLKNESNVNWSINDALFKKGQVYLKIPAEKGNGIVHVDINGATREFKAKTLELQDIKTGAPIVVVDVEGEYVVVKELE